MTIAQSDERTRDENARRVRRAPSLGELVFLVPAGFVALLALYPLVKVAWQAFYVDGRLTTQPLQDAFTAPGTAAMITSTLVLVVSSTVIALVVGGGLAFINERTDARIGILGEALPIIPFMLPPVAGAIGWVLLLAPRGGMLNTYLRDLLGVFGVHLDDGPFDIYSWFGLIFVMVIYQVPYAFLSIANGLRSFDGSTEEQSRVCGAGKWATLRRVTTPALRPSIGAAVFLMMWQGFALYSVPAIIGTPAHIDILSVRIVRLLTFSFPPDTGQAVALSLIVVVLTGIPWYFQVRTLRRGRFMTIGGKGVRLSPTRLGIWRLPARLAVIGYGVVAVVLPIGALVLVSLTGFWSPRIRWGSLSLSRIFETFTNDELTREGFRNSTIIAITGATIGIAVALILAVGQRTKRSRAAVIIDGAIRIPSVFSHIVIAVGFILAYAGSPFNLHGTLTILILAYLVMYLPQASAASDAAAGQVSDQLVDASRISGASARRTLGRIYVPLMIPGLVAGWAFLFTRMIGDLTASVLLSGTTNMVVGLRIMTVYENGSFADVATIALALTALTTVIVTGALAIGRRGSRWREGA